MKKFLAIIFCLICAGAIVYGWPFLDKRSNSQIIADLINDKSLLNQEISNYYDYEVSYHKIYSKGKLIGVIKDYDYLMSLIEDKYKDFEDEFPNTSLGLGQDVYIVEEKSYANFENIDDDIFNYLVKNNLLGIKTTEIEFSTSSGVYEIIYVNSIFLYLSFRLSFDK